MEGAYNRVLTARQTVPHETYVYFMDLLARTVRWQLLEAFHFFFYWVYLTIIMTYDFVNSFVGMRLLGAVRRRMTLSLLKMHEKCYWFLQTKNFLITSKRFHSFFQFFSLLLYELLTKYELKWNVQEHPEWEVKNGLVVFQKAKESAPCKEIPSLQLINQTLSYARELERIVWLINQTSKTFLNFKKKKSLLFAFWKPPHVVLDY